LHTAGFSICSIAAPSKTILVVDGFVDLASNSKNPKDIRAKKFENHVTRNITSNQERINSRTVTIPLSTRIPYLSEQP
jgi:hypothetical protein